MARPEDRMRLKDKIIDNISKAIKSIQSHHFYKTSETSSGRSGSGFTFGNVDRPCHKLCENLDHAFLHGLKNVTHGYWTVVKQLSHKGMIKEIEMLINVTTDLGRGRAWLYASLNEGLLESYLRMLDENEKMVKKYYAKEALLLDHDRINLLLTLITGLECVTFQLDLDQPYLDLNAYPPRGRSDSELEESVEPSPLYVENDRRVSEVSVASSTSSRLGRLPSDSDSSSLASLDVQSPVGTDPSAPPFQNVMRTSTVSSDSGFPAGGKGGGGTTGGGGEALTPSSSWSSVHMSNSTERRSVTPTGCSTNHHQKHRGSTAMDSVSVSSHGSGGDPDRIQRIEHILPQRDCGDEDPETASLEVIRVKSKRGSSASNKGKKKKRDRGQEENVSVRKDRAKTFSGEAADADSKSLGGGASHEVVIQKNDDKIQLDKHSLHHETKELQTTTSISVCDGDSDSITDRVNVGSKNDVISTSLPQFDSGVDIHSLLVSDSPAKQKASEKPTPKAKSEEPKSAFAQIENKIAELCFVAEEEQVPRGKMIDSTDSGNLSSLSNTNDILYRDSISDLKGKDKSLELGTRSQHVSSHDSSVHSMVNKREQSHSLLSTSTTQNVYNSGAGQDALDGSSSSGIAPHKPHQVQNKMPSPETNIRQGRQFSDSGATTGELEAEDEFDFYACHESEADQGDAATSNTGSQMTEATAQISNAHAASELEDYMDFILQRAESPPESLSSQLSPQEQVKKPVDLAMSLDNNTKLQVMLDIFTKEQEKFIKMFATRENHTEGEPAPVFVLISDHCLYLLHYKKTRRKFVLSSSANLVDLIFVSTGLNDQTLNIESREKSRQKQRLWLTPGHQNLTQAILTCLTDAVKAANEHIVSVRSRFSVGSEVPLQKIALRKYISKELNSEAQDVTIHDYSLVFWEDPASESGSLSDAACKEGTLLLRTHDPIKGHVWKPVYVVLKDSMLCVSNHKTDVRPHSYLGLGGDQCVGCRLVSTADRPHCVELVLSSGAGGSWFLSAASEAEISEWRHSLCLAVSQGMQDPNTLSSCIPCCAVLSCNHLFMCHEDLHTKFFRTLGRAQLEDVTGISVDSKEPTYCVIEFESQEAGVSSVEWVLYFAASLDRDRHTAAISHEWKENYKIDLPIVQLDNMSLQRHCRTYAELLRKQLSIS